MIEWLALAVSSISFLVSVGGYLSTKNNHTDTLTSDLITENWQQFLSLHDTAAAFPYHTYLFEIGSEYDKAIELVKAAIESLPEGERTSAISTARLQERALVRKILSMFEHALYQANHAVKTKDKVRESFFKDVLFYYTDRLLKNPRISWYWSTSGGNLRVHMEESTREYCESKVEFSVVDSSSPFSLLA